MSRPIMGYEVLLVSPDNSYTTVVCQPPPTACTLGNYAVAEVVPVRLEGTGGVSVYRWGQKRGLNRAIAEGRVHVIRGQPLAAGVSVTPGTEPTGARPLRLPTNLPRWFGGWPMGRSNVHLAPHWLAIAFDHLQAAEAAHLARESATQQADPAAVIQELSSSMQATRAAVIALDLFCLAVQEHVSIPRATLDTWRKQKRAKSTQALEILRRGFTVDDTAVPMLREWLRDIHSLNDHAASATPRYSQFQCELAHSVVCFCLVLIAQLVLLPKEHKGLMRYCADLRPMIQRAVDQWEAAYGPLVAESASYLGRPRQ